MWSRVRKRQRHRDTERVQKKGSREKLLHNMTLPESSSFVHHQRWCPVGSSFALWVASKAERRGLRVKKRTNQRHQVIETSKGRRSRRKGHVAVGLETGETAVRSTVTASGIGIQSHRHNIPLVALSLFGFLLYKSGKVVVFV